MENDKSLENVKELGFKSDEFRSLSWQEVAKIENNTDEICPSCGENVGWNVFDNTAQCYECKTASKKNENGLLVGNEDIFNALANILNPKNIGGNK